MVFTNPSFFLWEPFSASVHGDTTDQNAGAAQRATTEICDYEAPGTQVGGIADFYIRLLSLKFSTWSGETKEKKRKKHPSACSLVNDEAQMCWIKVDSVNRCRAAGGAEEPGWLVVKHQDLVGVLIRPSSLRL